MAIMSTILPEGNDEERGNADEHGGRGLGIEDCFRILYVGVGHVVQDVSRKDIEIV